MKSAVLLIQLVYFVPLLVALPVSQFDYSIPPYSTKTGYYRSFTEEEKKIFESTDSYVPDVCTPIHYTNTIRHGSRYPGADDILVMRELADRIRGKVNNPDHVLLNDTTVDFPLEEGDNLTFMGRKEMYDMGQRVAKRWASFLEPANPSELVYQDTYKPRTTHSAYSFQNGLSDAFGKNMTQPIDERNDLIRFYETCPYYVTSVEENPEALEEYTLFQTGPELTPFPGYITGKLQMPDDVQYNLGR